MTRATPATISYPFTPAQQEAIRGIRAAFPPRKVMVRNRMREGGYALVQAGGSTWIVTKTGGIRSCQP